MTTESVSAAPGWYPDGQGAVRFFDGAAWTQHTQPVAPPAPVAPVAPGAPAGAAAPAQVAPAAKSSIFRQGWFIVDAVVLVGIVGVILYAAFV